MMVGSLPELAQQCALSPSIKKALNFLNEAQVQSLSEGKIDIDGTRVYAIVQTYMTKPDTDKVKFEAHCKYIDIQYLVSGKEQMGWAPLDKLMTTVPYDAEKDIRYGVVPPDEATLIRYAAGQAVILYPTDAHAPGLSHGDSQTVKKIVVKVAVDSQTKAST